MRQKEVSRSEDAKAASFINVSVCPVWRQQQI